VMKATSHRELVETTAFTDYPRCWRCQVVQLSATPEIMAHPLGSTAVGPSASYGLRPPGVDAGWPLSVHDSMVRHVDETFGGLLAEL
jgi:hypothetical protein